MDFLINSSSTVYSRPSYINWNLREDRKQNQIYRRHRCALDPYLMKSTQKQSKPQGTLIKSKRSTLKKKTTSCTKLLFRYSKKLSLASATEDKITISDQNQIFFHTNESFKIIHLNAQSARNKVDELSLLCEEARPAVLVISEHSFTE